MSRSLRDYITEAERRISGPVEGDEFDIEIAPGDIVSTYVLESTEDSVTLYGDDKMFALLEEIKRYGAVGANNAMGYSLAEENTDIKRKVFRKNGEPVGEVGQDPDASPGQGEWYFKHYDSGTDLSGYDSYAEAVEELRHLIKQQPNKSLQATRDFNRGRRADAMREQDVAEDTNSVDLGEDQFFQRVLELAGCGRSMSEAEANTTDPLAAKAAALAPVSAQGSSPAVNIDEGFMSDIDLELHNIARSEDEEELIDALGGLKGGEVQIALEDMMEDLADELAAKGMTDVINDDDKMIELLMDKLVAEYSEGDLDEAKYQGREVPLNKPMAGDVAKSKVYVKDPKTGNVKKVNFGDPNMKIKKSNPARRKSFRARHNCDNPGPRTKARYWSCKAW